ncbi:MAG: A24 family peptidase, partial [Nitrospinota bacterium]|nr:A24 family peptidase [Nitrospinota bacterium]
GGDIKYIAAVGALVGWEKVLLIIFMGAFLGSIVSIFQMALQKKSRKSLIPFGPFLSVATLITLFYGNLLIKLYVEGLGR